jgi:hypothetical protein
MCDEVWAYLAPWGNVVVREGRRLSIEIVGKERLAGHFPAAGCLRAAEQILIEYAQAMLQSILLTPPGVVEKIKIRFARLCGWQRITICWYHHEN